MCAEGVSDEYDPKELVCGACSNVAAAQVSGNGSVREVRGVRVRSVWREGGRESGK